MTPEQATPHDDTACPNCAAALNGPYCSSCGQRLVDLDRPFRELASEVMESFLSFDARMFRTLWPLVSRPGWLTVEFLAGRRARYIHPFKLFFAFSVLLFLVVSFSGHMAVRVNSGDGRVVAGLQVDAAEAVTEGEEDPSSEPEESSALGRLFKPVGELAANDPVRLNRIFTDRFAKSVILLVPIFAALLRVLYWRRRYVAHIVFSLHLHSFAFLAMMVGVLRDWSVDAPQGQGWGNAVAVTVIATYSFFALRRVYEQGRFLTLLKMGFLFVGYMVALIVTMALTFALTAVTL